MFDFIFKRSAGSPSATDAPAYQPSPDNRPAQLEAKQSALAQAEALGEDEGAALAFLLQCEFAEARLKAAEHLHSRAVLATALEAMRNTDRRVAKLLQSRLDHYQQQELAQRQAQQCIDIARELAQERHLLPNRVADLDRSWQLVAAVPAQLQQEFDHARSILRERLEAQASLQRAVMDVLARLRALREQAERMPVAELGPVLNAIEEEFETHRTAREVQSLPRHLLPEIEQELQGFRQDLTTLASRQEAISAHLELLERWEADPVTVLKEEKLKREWQALSPMADGDTQRALQTRYEALVAGVVATQQSRQAAVTEKKQDALGQFLANLESLEKALESGSLHQASDQDKVLRALDLKSAKLSEAHSERLAKARAELGRLQGWAKWGGKVSREELLKAAEGLPVQELAALELAKKVGSLRERWKSLDGSAGPAPRELWERFDTACSAAYAPAAAHFKKLADERQNNQIKAEALIVEIRHFAESSLPGAEVAAAPDWKTIAQFCQRSLQSWQRLGVIERKEKKRLDAEFDLAMKTLSEPLESQRHLEIRRREKLIAQVNELNPGDRSAPDRLRSLQEQWQVLAKALPLARKDEQDLWQRFRRACDEVFSKRKENAAAADAERLQNLHSKEEVCASLEAAVNGSEVEIAKAVREAREAWAAAGPVPRASEAKIDARYKLAAAELQKQIDAAKRRTAAARTTALRDKLVLCNAVEQALVDGAVNAEDWRPKWQALPALSGDFERTMRARFDAAVAAMQSGGIQYAEALKQSRGSLSQELLRLEMMVGIESPPEMARDRLKLQVELLQSSLKAGQKPLTPEAQLLRVCGLAALADEQSSSRLAQAIDSLKNI
ncbi:hypothetical protein BH11PSE11_BH11PSE11_06350 [soil metagenome]